MLEEGMDITNEAGIYVTGVEGVRNEDDILVYNEGYEV
ncbi:M24 family metallopeptidase [Staphylococcus aureus]|nr:M24 family metallopeptidase [Staphylococcus aureus]